MLKRKMITHALILLLLLLVPEFARENTPSYPILGFISWIAMLGVFYLKKTSSTTRFLLMALGFFIWFFLILNAQQFFPWTPLLPLIFITSFLLSSKKTHLFRLFLPIALPYTALSLIVNLRYGTIYAILLIIALAFAFPSIVNFFWKARHLKRSEKTAPIFDLAKKAGFSKKKLFVWNASPCRFTAGIIGLIPGFRCIFFTKHLLLEFSQDEIGAILTHEIGHSKKGHLWIYLLLYVGFTIFLSPLFALTYAFIPNVLDLSSLVLLALFVAFGWLYFRFVFGYFSRQLEREADLYVTHFAIPVQSMIQALQRLGEKTHALKKDSWHHGSIQERITFLEKVKKNPNLIRSHERWVKTLVLSYFAVVSVVFSFILTSKTGGFL